MTEFELSEELLSQMGVDAAPENGTRRAKFDYAGTLHIMYRDEEGALKKDSPLLQKEHPAEDKPSDNVERMEEMRALKKKSRFLRNFAIFLLAMLAFSTLMAFALLSRLR